MVETTFAQAQERALKRYGVTAQQREIEVAGRKAAMLVVGDGPPVVMVGGAGTSAAMFAPLMARIEGRTIFAVDWPGHGLSEGDPTFAADLRRGSVEFLTGVLDGLGLEQASVIASSFGSWATSRLALEHPDRVAALVHLGCPAVVLDTSAPLPMRLFSVRPLARLMMKAQPPSPRQVRQLAEMVGEHPLDPAIADVLLATERQPDFEASFTAIIRGLVRLRGSRPESHLGTSDLERVGQPTLLVFGSGDPFGGPSVGERMAEAMPDARLHVVDGGHAPWLRSSGRVGELTNEFLAEVASGTR